MKLFVANGIPRVRNICNPGSDCCLGEYGVYNDGCVTCSHREVCKGVKDAYEAPLQSLPLYTTSKYPEVRYIAQVRFIELQELPLQKQLPRHSWRHLLRFLRSFLPTSHKI